jgi:hypothetical protein
VCHRASVLHPELDISSLAACWETCNKVSFAWNCLVIPHLCASYLYTNIHLPVAYSSALAYSPTSDCPELVSRLLANQLPTWNQSQNQSYTLDLDTTSSLLVQPHRKTHNVPLRRRLRRPTRARNRHRQHDQSLALRLRRLVRATQRP